MKKTAMLVMMLALVAVMAAAQDGSSDLTFTVVKADNGAPVRNAYVVLHAVDKKGHQEKGGYELKTDLDGKTAFPGAPYGTLRVQVLKHGFQTYGQDFEIDQPTHSFVIKLKRPQPQYSIYGNDNANNKSKDDSKPKE